MYFDHIHETLTHLISIYNILDFRPRWWSKQRCFVNAPVLMWLNCSNLVSINTGATAFLHLVAEDLKSVFSSWRCSLFSGNHATCVLCWLSICRLESEESVRRRKGKRAGRWRMRLKSSRPSLNNLRIIYCKCPRAKKGGLILYTLFSLLTLSPYNHWKQLCA